MPTLAELRSRTDSRKRGGPRNTKDEAIVADRRSTLRPAQIVEQKLRVALLKSIR
jgi:hypothetical protein